MKKFLVLALVVVLTLSFAVVASAAALDAYVGGRLTWSYVDTDYVDPNTGASRENAPSGTGNGGIKLLLKGTVRDEETGTWGTIGAKLDGWEYAGGKDLNTSGIYEFGIDGVAGSNFNVWYTNFENEKGNQGMARIYNIDVLQTHTDCMFDRDLLDHVLGVDYVSDNVRVNLGYEFNENAIADGNIMSIAAGFKFDGGEVHVGNYDGKISNNVTGNSEVKASEINVGGSYAFGFGTISFDYLGQSYDPSGMEDSSVIQVGATVDAINLGVTVAALDGIQFKDGGIAYELKYKPLDNVTLCYRAATADEDADEGNNFTNFYVGYNYGLIEARVGMYTKGEDEKANNIKQDDGVYASCYVSFW